jgi:hypothetical protein
MILLENIIGIPVSSWVDPLSSKDPSEFERVSASLSSGERQLLMIKIRLNQIITRIGAYKQHLYGCDFRTYHHPRPKTTVATRPKSKTRPKL